MEKSSIGIDSNNSPFFWDIVRYIRHEIPVAEIAELDKQLLASAEAWNVFQYLYALEKAGELEGFLQRQSNLLPQKHVQQVQPKFNFPTKRVYQVAASVGLLFIFGLAAYWAGNQGQASPEKIYQAYYTPYQPIQVTARTVENSNAKENGLFDDAVLMYQQQEYEATIQLLSKYDPKNVDASLLIGVSWLEQSEPDSAVAVLKQIIKQPKATAPMKNHAHWYMAMAYLKKGDVTQAHEHLSMLSQSDNFYKKKATKAMKQF